jgi:hypothetical protein
MALSLVMLTPKVMDSMRIIPCPELIVVGVEHTLMRKTCFAYSQNIMEEELICSVLMWPFTELQP